MNSYKSKTLKKSINKEKKSLIDISKTIKNECSGINKKMNK